jgi:methylmalonyl-CoA/ethylmalonyl-CoA epimerase
MPKVRALDHIAIATDDLEESLAFWRDQLGLEASHTEELPDRGIKVAFLPIGDTRIELVAPLREDSEISGFLAKRGPGIHHMAFESADVDADVDALKDGGVRIAQDPAPGAHDCRVAFIHPKSSKGTLIELSTPPAKADG